MWKNVYRIRISLAERAVPFYTDLEKPAPPIVVQLRNIDYELRIWNRNSEYLMQMTYQGFGIRITEYLICKMGSEDGFGMQVQNKEYEFGIWFIPYGFRIQNRNYVIRLRNKDYVLGIRSRKYLIRIGMRITDSEYGLGLLDAVYVSRIRIAAYFLKYLMRIMYY